MRRHLVVVLAALAAVALAIALYVIHARPVHAAPPEALAKLAFDQEPRNIPSVPFTDARGKRLTLAVFDGRYVLLNLWATWCAPCVRELPALAHLQRALPSLTIVAVNEGRGTPADTAAFLEAHGAGSLHVYLDTDHAFLQAMGAFGLPLSLLIDARGQERARALGPAEWDDSQAIAYLRAVTSPASPQQAS